MKPRIELELLVEEQFDREVPAAAHALAAAALQRFPDALAVVFYGSCLRDVDAVDAVLDLYVLVDSYEKSYDRRVLVWLNRILPPNVFFLAAQCEGVEVRAKYAVVTLSSFVSSMADTTRESYFWGRFAQPTAVVYAASPDVASALAGGLATAVETFVLNAVPLVGPTFSARELWVAGLSQSYSSELRAEGPDRTAALFVSFAEYYERATRLALAAMPYPVVRDGDGWKAEVPTSERAGRLRRWRERQVYSKVLSLLRILRNAYTAEGGVEYTMWKIERHGDFRFDKSWRSKPVPLFALGREVLRAWRAGAFR